VTNLQKDNKVLVNADGYLPLVAFRLHLLPFVVARLVNHGSCAHHIKRLDLVY